MRSRSKETSIPIIGLLVMLVFIFTVSYYLGAVEQGMTESRNEAKALERALQEGNARRMERTGEDSRVPRSRRPASTADEMEAIFAYPAATSANEPVGPAHFGARTAYE